MKTQKPNNQQLLIISISALITLTVALLFVFSIGYNSCVNELAEEKTITKQQETKFPPPPEQRYYSGIIKSVGEESFILRLKSKKETEIFFNGKTEIFKGEGKGIKVSKEEIQPDYHTACFLPKDKNNNTALIVHMTTDIASNNKK
jgi:hypothetical protein